MLYANRHFSASSDQRRTGMKIQSSWKVAAAETSVHRGTCMKDFKNIPCRIKITRDLDLKQTHCFANAKYITFFILFMQHKLG
jgi:hypothetical protein